MGGLFFLMRSSRCFTHLLRTTSAARAQQCKNDRFIHVNTAHEDATQEEKNKRARDRSPAEEFLTKQYAFIRRQHRLEATARKELASLPTMSHHRVFPNHLLDLSKVDVYGFDFDFVLASYTPQLQPLIYNLVKEIMVKEKKYPDDFMKFEYDPSFAVRGLHFDCQQGVLMKLDFVFNINIETVYLGREQLQPHQVYKRYPGLHLKREYAANNLRHICDLFGLSECTLLADIVQYFVERSIQFDAASVYRDVRDAVQFVHQHTLHTAIQSNIPLYVEEKPELGALLAKIREEGRTTFMLTNNQYSNVDYLMRFIVPELPAGYPDWTSLFDVVMTVAGKPRFFTDKDRPFRQLNSERDGVLWTPVKSLERGEVYRAGCLTTMERLTKWGKRSVLYMGDHIQNDLIDAVKHWGWRTCAIIKELDEAITCHNSLEYRNCLSFHEQLYILHSMAVRQLPRDHELITKIDRHISSLTRDLMHLRHPKFGCVFKSGTKETIIAYQLLRFADIYTSRVENILSSPAGVTLTPSRRLMAHDISITPYVFMAK